MSYSTHLRKQSYAPGLTTVSRTAQLSEHRARDRPMFIYAATAREQPNLSFYHDLHGGGLSGRASVSLYKTKAQRGFGPCIIFKTWQMPSKQQFNALRLCHSWDRCGSACGEGRSHSQGWQFIANSDPKVPPPLLSRLNLCRWLWH